MCARVCLSVCGIDFPELQLEMVVSHLVRVMRSNLDPGPLEEEQVLLVIFLAPDCITAQAKNVNMWSPRM